MFLFLANEIIFLTLISSQDPLSALISAFKSNIIRNFDSVANLYKFSKSILLIVKLLISWPSTGLIISSDIICVVYNLIGI